MGGSVNTLKTWGTHSQLLPISGLSCVGALHGVAELITLINFASTRMDLLEEH